MVSRLLRVACLGLGVLVGGTAGLGCSVEEGEDVGEDEGAVATPGTVEHAALTSCSTIAVRGLSEQLVDEMLCLRPGLFTKMEGVNNLSFEPEVFPYLQTPAANALRRAVDQLGRPVLLNSALRTIPQQFMLKRWDVRNRCGVRVAASVGNSNHEPGLAIDVDLGGGSTANTRIRTALRAQGFTWLGAGDPMHYNYDGPGTQDIEGVSVLAFKRLWNRNHPEAPLPLTEAYDVATEAKLKRAPVGGFAVGARCDSP